MVNRINKQFLSGKPILLVGLISVLFACQSQQSKTSGLPKSASGSDATIAVTNKNQWEISDNGEVGTRNQAIPKPSEMLVDIVASGRVSTLNSIDYVHVGKKIPYTYSDGKISNTPGFEWWVSKHFAMKTNLSDKDVKHYLELLEMSYPHYIELFGVEPPNIENQRIAVVYATTRDELKVSMLDDGFQRGVHESAGGETMYWNRAGYNFVSARMHHQRYIVIHETAHAFQMSVMKDSSYLPTWFTEGTADALAHHVYDPLKKQLKFMTFDRGPMDYVKMGLKEYKALNSPTIAEMTGNSTLYRGVNFFIIHFMLNSPERSHGFKAYRDEMVRLKLSDDAAKSVEVLQSVFDDWDQVEKEFAEYVANIETKINIISNDSYGPWEQDGNAYWLRNYSAYTDHDERDDSIYWLHAYNHNLGTPRVEFDFRPNQKPKYYPFQIDYPLGEKSPLVGNVARGVENPALGVEIAFIKGHLNRGIAGMALGVEISPASLKKIEKDKVRDRREKISYNNDDDETYRVFIEHGHTLVVDSSRLGGERLAFPLPSKMMQSLVKQDNPKLGITVTINSQSVDVVVMTDEKKKIRYQESIRIDNDLREKLLRRPLGLIAKSAGHRVTPFFDDGRDLNPHPRDLMIEAPVNTFANAADHAISRITRAIWRLEGKVMDDVYALRKEMIDATDKGPDAQAKSLKQFQTERKRIAGSFAVGDDLEQVNQALVEFSGATLRIEWNRQQPDERYPLSVVLRNPSDANLSGELQLLTTDEDGVNYIMHAEKVNIAAKGKHRLYYTTAKPVAEDKTVWMAKADLQWEGQQFHLTDISNYPYNWSTMDIIEAAHIENGEIKIGAILRGPLNGESNGKLIIEVQPGNIVENGLYEEKVSIAPYERKKYSHSFKLKDGVKADHFAVLVRFDVEFDGEAVRLEQRSIVE